MMPLNHLPRKCKAGYKLRKSLEKINDLMYMDDIKLFPKNEKELETLIHTVRIYSQNIGMKFGIEIYNPSPVLENDTHKLQWDVNIQTDDLILARTPDLIVINNKKENLQNWRFCCSSGLQNISGGKWKEG